MICALLSLEFRFVMDARGKQHNATGKVSFRALTVWQTQSSTAAGCKCKAQTLSHKWLTEVESKEFQARTISSSRAVAPAATLHCCRFAQALLSDFKNARAGNKPEVWWRDVARDKVWDKIGVSRESMLEEPCGASLLCCSD